MKASLRQLVETLTAFALLFVGTFFLYPYVATSVTYNSASNVSALFPIAIWEEGNPAIVRWDEYKRNPEAFEGKLIVAPAAVPFELESREFFTTWS